jgi:hypothetical protein
VAWIDRIVSSVMSEPLVALVAGVVAGFVIGYAMATTGGRYK